MKCVLIPFFLLAVLSAFGQDQKAYCDYSQNDTVDGLNVLIFVEKKPEFPGGERELLEYLSNNIKYPVMDKTDDLQYKVSATFVVDTNGTIRNSCILRPKYPDRLTDIELEIIRVLKNMPAWAPGYNDGEKVPVRFQLPINIEWQ